MTWFVVRTYPSKQQSAAVDISAAGFQAYVPLMPRRRFIAGLWREDNIPRFGPYIFAQFDVDIPGWQNLLYGPARSIAQILSDAQCRPVPVPEEAIVAVQSMKVQLPAEPSPYRFRPGECCSVFVGGHRQDAVFVEYRGNRQFVQTWIFGAPHTIEVRVADLEPVEAS